MTQILPLKKIMYQKGFQFSFKRLDLIQFFNVIWHLIVESNSHIHDTFC